MIRNKESQALAKALESARKHVGDVKGLLVQSLGGTLRETYDFVVSRASKGVTSAELAKHLSISINYASTMLAELKEAGLLRRVGNITADGHEYRYWVRAS